MRQWRLSGLLGSGIGYSLSPSLHEEEAQEHGIRLAYLLLDAADLDYSIGGVGAVVDAARRLGFAGLNVTQPFKAEVAQTLDEVVDEAADLQAVNTIVFGSDGRSVGHNTDVGGFADGLERVLRAPDLTSVVQFGAGGAGAATAYALLRSGAGALAIHDPDIHRADALVARLWTRFPMSAVSVLQADEVPRAVAGATGIVNASTVGSESNPGTPLDPRLVESHHWVADIHYAPARTEFLAVAQRRGCTTMNGAPMLAFQAARAFDLIHDVAPDRERMWRHLQSLVAQVA